MKTRLAGLRRRGPRGGFVLRIVVPKDLQEAFGRKDVQYALGTADEALALSRALQMRVEWNGKFDRTRQELAEREGKHHKRRYADSYLEGLAKELFDREMAADEAERRFHRERPALDPLLGNSLPGAWARERHLQAMKDDLHRGNYHHVTWYVDAVIERKALSIVPQSPDWNTLAYSCQRAMIDAKRVAVDRDKGEFGTLPKDPIITKPKTVSNPDHTFEKLFARYRSFSAVRPDTLNQDEKVIGLLADFVGPEIGPLDIRGEHIREFRDAVLTYPIKAAQTKAFKGLSMRDTIRVNQGLGDKAKDTISEKTWNRYCSGLSSFFKWLIAEDHITTNPCAGKFIDKRRIQPKHPRTSFTGAELQTLINSNWFERDRDASWWLPLLALYTGARRGELAQLNKADIRTYDGRLCILITEFDESDATAKSLKNESSRRIVPVHNTLLNLGFEALLNGSQNNPQLFPALKPDTRGHWGTAISDNFNDHLKAIGLHSRPGTNKVKTFHSLRHTFVDAMRRIFHKNDVELLTGHAKTMIDGYTHIADSMLPRKLEMIDALDYDISLSHLK